MNNKIIRLTQWHPAPNCLNRLSSLIDSGNIATNGEYSQKAQSLLLKQYAAFSADVMLMSSCTAALEVAALSGRLGYGDEVIVPAFTFPSTINCIAQYGAKPIFADVDFASGNILPGTVKQLITDKTKAVIVVHYAGAAKGIDELAVFCRERGLVLIEDAAHAYGALYKNTPLGCFGDYGALSFHYSKNIGCGEGGALIVRDKNYASTVKQIRDNGTNRSDFMDGKIASYDWQSLGTNAMLSEVSASILYGQFENSDWIQQQRHKVWDTYQLDLCSWAKANGVLQPAIDANCQHGAHIYHLVFPSSNTAEDFIRYMLDNNIQVLSHFRPLHLSPAGMAFGGYKGMCPNAETLSKTLVRLPIHPYLKPHEQEYIIEVIKKYDCKKEAV